jgi:hypothetical protein
VSTVGLRPPFDTPAAAFSSRLSRRSHLDCRAAPVAHHVDRNAAVGPWVGLLGTWYNAALDDRFPSFSRIDNICNFPEAISHAGRHRGRRAGVWGL